MGEPKSLQMATITSAGGGNLANKYEITGQIFPTEVWDLIYKNVESPKDLLSCWNTNSVWTKALRTTDFYFKMTLPFLIPQLNRKDFLVCSAVSKSWSAAVDACIQYVDHGEYIGHHCRIQPISQQIRLNTTLRHDNLARFLNTITTISTCQNPTVNIRVANPVVFRRVEVSLTYEHNADNPFTLQTINLLKCLDHHGHLIRHLDLTFADTNETSYLERIKLVRSCLERTPNLRVFLINIPAYDVRVSDEERNRFIRELEAFHDFDSKHPWPALNHLEVLAFDVTTSKKEFFSIVNAYGPTLRFLQFGFRHMEPNQLHPGRFFCLQKIVYYFSKFCNGVQLGAFVQSNKCPLKHLTVAFHCDKPDAQDYEGFTIAANSASDTLEILHFWVHGLKTYNLDVTKLDKMRLPRLKVLNLDTFGYPTLQFLKSVCPALQTLTVTPTFVDSRHKVLRPTNGGVYTNLYSEHQFWNELVDIRQIAVEYLVCSEKKGKNKTKTVIEGHMKPIYTRDEYNKILENGQGD